jgi:serine/threonine protein kinase
MIYAVISISGQSMSTESSKTDVLNKTGANSKASEANTNVINKHRGPLTDFNKSTDAGSAKKTLKNRFILDSVIARGGMGIVYKARDLRKIEAMDSDPYVAIKLLKPDNNRIRNNFISLQRETRKTQMLSHPNIVNVHDFDRDGDTFMMTMEYLHGEALSDKIKNSDESHPLPRDEAFRIIESIGSALIYAHSKNIIHCDLKPANIFICKDNVVKVLDFGIARAFHVNKILEVNENLNRGNQRALTPAYASCEMLDGETPEPRDDIFALACIAYELLTGSHPFNRKSCQQALNQGVQLAPVAGLSRRQWKILASGLASKREHRPDNVQDFIHDLVPGEGSGLRIWALPVLSAIILSGLFVYNQFSITAEHAREDFVTAPFETLNQPDQEKVLALLEIADAHMMVQRYTEPPGSNAYSAFQEILTVHPGNPQALSGLNRIAEVYVRLARNYMDNDNHQTALKLVQEGLDLIPRHEALLQLQEQLR